MNTASNWPMGSTLAQLNLELQTTPFATPKVGVEKTPQRVLKTGSTQSTIVSSTTLPMSLNVTSKTGLSDDVTKWSQTR